MIILSLFDGISCGKVALDRAGINVKKYYASEIDKNAIKISSNNHKDIIQLGDISNWRNWDIERPDLILAGSPCQGFSFAGKQKGFDDDRSSLINHFFDILEFFKPKYFLLENVRMKKEFQEIITRIVGVEPIQINSALVSAQNRVRLYWSNIPNISQPEDKGIVLKHITISDAISCARVVNRRKDENNIRQDSDKSIPMKPYIEPRKDQKSNCITRFNKDSVLVVGEASDIKGFDSRRHVYSEKGKSPSLLTHSDGNSEVKIAVDGARYRYLTPIECERLQTLPDDYTNYVSKTQRYRALSNAWTVDVIAHILKGILL